MLCHFQVSLHISSKVRFVCQPKTFCALSAFAQNSGKSPALRGHILPTHNLQHFPFLLIVHSELISDNYINQRIYTNSSCKKQLTCWLTQSISHKPCNCQYSYWQANSSNLTPESCNIKLRNLHIIPIHRQAIAYKHRKTCRKSAANATVF